MYEKTFEVSESPRITIEDCVGNLNVKRGGANQVTVNMPDDEDTLVFDQPTVHSTSSIPRGISKSKILMAMSKLAQSTVIRIYGVLVR